MPDTVIFAGRMSTPNGFLVAELIESCCGRTASGDGRLFCGMLIDWTKHRGRPTWSSALGDMKAGIDFNHEKGVSRRIFRISESHVPSV